MNKKFLEKNHKAQEAKAKRYKVSLSNKQTKKLLKAKQSAEGKENMQNVKKYLQNIV